MNPISWRMKIGGISYQSSGYDLQNYVLGQQLI